MNFVSACFKVYLFTQEHRISEFARLLNCLELFKISDVPQSLTFVRNELLMKEWSVVGQAVGRWS